MIGSVREREKVKGDSCGEGGTTAMPTRDSGKEESRCDGRIGRHSYITIESIKERERRRETAEEREARLQCQPDLGKEERRCDGRIGRHGYITIENVREREKKRDS